MAIAPLPVRRWLVVFLCLAVILLAVTWLYFDAAHANPPRWVQLVIPLQAVLIGVIWMFREISRVSLAWRRGIAGFFFVLAAVELIIFFV